MRQIMPEPFLKIRVIVRMTLILMGIAIPLVLVAAIPHIDSDSTPSDMVRFYDQKIPFDKVA